MNDDLIALHRFIVDAFSLEELYTLCFTLFVDCENFESGGKEATARELVLYLQRRGRLPDLHLALARERPQQYSPQFAHPSQPRNLQSPIIQSPVSQSLVSESPVSPTRNPHQVFISHAHQDADFAHRLAADLQVAGWQVWLAPDSIRPGERWVDAINRGLDESGVFVLVLTPAAVASRWVSIETNVALEMEVEGVLQFVPLEVEQCPIPPMWRAYQRIPFESGYIVGLVELLRQLKGIAR